MLLSVNPLYAYEVRLLGTIETVFKVRNVKGIYNFPQSNPHNYCLHQLATLLSSLQFRFNQYSII
jgi:hypothetical protein